MRRWNVLGYALLMAFVLAAPVSADSATALRYAPAGDFAVAYRDLGSGDIPLVLVHGWGCDHTFWRYQIPFFASRGRVIALDLPGHGWSTKPKVPYTRDVFLEGIKAVLDAAGVSRAVLAGHSMGGGMVRFFALRHPDRVAGLILVDPALINVPEDPQGRAETEKMLAGFAAAMADGPDYRDRVKGFVEPMFVPETPDPVRRLVLEKMTGTPAYVGASAMHDFTRVALWEDRRPVYAPTLALFAEASTRMEAPGFEDFVHRLFPHLSYEVWSGVSHFYMLEVPDRLNDRLAAFLKEIR